MEGVRSDIGYVTGYNHALECGISVKRIIRYHVGFTLKGIGEGNAGSVVGRSLTEKHVLGIYVVVLIEEQPAVFVYDLARSRVYGIRTVYVGMRDLNRAVIYYLVKREVNSL